MSTIQEVMSDSSNLLARAGSGEIDAGELQKAVTQKLSSSLGARGFMAALATQTLPADEKIKNALIAAIRSGKKNAYELIIKNIIMAGCAAQQHSKNNDANAAQGSKQTAATSVDLALLINDPILAEMATAAIEAISNWSDEKARETLPPTENSPAASFTVDWFVFFQRWKYSRQLLDNVIEQLKKVARTN